MLAPHINGLFSNLGRYPTSWVSSTRSNPGIPQSDGSQFIHSQLKQMSAQQRRSTSTTIEVTNVTLLSAGCWGSCKPGFAWKMTRLKAGKAQAIVSIEFKTILIFYFAKLLPLVQKMSLVTKLHFLIYWVTGGVTTFVAIKVCLRLMLVWIAAVCLKNLTNHIKNSYTASFQTKQYRPSCLVHVQLIVTTVICIALCCRV